MKRSTILKFSFLLFPLVSFAATENENQEIDNQNVSSSDQSPTLRDTWIQRQFGKKGREERVALRGKPLPVGFKNQPWYEHMRRLNVGSTSLLLFWLAYRVYPTLFHALKGMGGVIFSLDFLKIVGLLLIPIMGGFTVFFASKSAISTIKAACIGVVVSLVLVVGEWLMAAYMYEKEYRVLKKKAKRLLRPTLLLLAVFVPPLSSFYTYGLLTFRVGLQLWQSAFATMLVGGIATFLGNAYISFVEKDEKERKQGFLAYLSDDLTKNWEALKKGIPAKT